MSSMILAAMLIACDNNDLSFPVALKKATYLFTQRAHNILTNAVVTPATRLQFRATLSP